MNNEKPMPLKDLPAYLDSVREHGQGDYVPVVDMGMIVDDRPRRRLRLAAYSTALCLFVAIGIVAYNSTERIVIDAADLGPQAVAEIIRDQGGRAFSVTENDDGTHEVRVFTFKRMSSFLEQLRKNKEFKKVEIK
jgi:hypothetical protein